jgi:hypothetical protein
MANITLSIPEHLRAQMDSYSEIRWSEVAKNAIADKVVELRKLSILKKYVDKQSLSDADFEWMDKHDWHPVDERPLKPSFVASLKASRKEKSSPATIDSLFK